jgi:sortase A
VSRTADVVRTVLRGTGQTLITLGVVLLLFCVYELKVTNLVTARAQEQLADDLRDRWDAPVAAAVTTPAPTPTSTAAVPVPPPSAAPAPPPPPPPPPAVELGSGFAVLRIPRLGDWNDRPPVVVEGVSTSDLKKGPGHIPGTALPGELGNVVLSGHRTTYGAPFERFDELRPGDAVVVETRDTWFTYTVTGTRIVRPSAVEVTYPVPGDRTATPTRRLLTMTTCHPRFSARERMVVSAELTATDPKSSGTPAALAEV